MLMGARVAPLSFSVRRGAGRPTIAWMHSALEAALQDVEPLVADRGWARPPLATIAAAERLLKLVDLAHRQPAIQANRDGTISFDWEAADVGWLTLTLDDQGHLTHGAVLDEDEFAQTETFGDELPDWAGTLLQRLLAAGH